MHLLFKNTLPSAGNKAREQPLVLQYETLPVPVHLFVEKRRNSRISLLRDKANVRLPRHLDKRQRQTELEKLIRWAVKHIDKTGLYGSSLAERNYLEKGEICIAGHLWKLQFTESSAGKRLISRTHMDEKVMEFRGDFASWNRIKLAEGIRDLMIRNFTKYYSNYTLKLVSSINDLTLKVKFENVRLKYMTSRWGSCSAKGNISLSLRLLLLPDEVRDYVIVHELVHLVHMNHSRSFWRMVEKYVPDYRNHENWLKSNGHLYEI